MLEIEFFGGPYDGTLLAIPHNEYPPFFVWLRVDASGLFTMDDPGEALFVEPDKCIYLQTAGRRFRYHKTIKHGEEGYDEYECK